MYQHERDKHFKQLEDSKSKKEPKLGPRDILGTRPADEYVTKEFIAHKFRNSLDDEVHKLLNIKKPPSAKMNISEPTIGGIPGAFIKTDSTQNEQFMSSG